MYANIELQSEPQVTVATMPDFSNGKKLTIKETNSNEQQKDWWQAKCEPVQILSDESSKHPINWWKMSNHISCISCITIDDVNENGSSFSCVECEEDQTVVITCCDKPSKNKRFAVRINE